MFFHIDKKLLPILSLTFVNVIGFSLLIPILPFIVDQYGGGSIEYGILLGSYSVFQFLGAPVLGALSDRFGRRPMLIISQLGTLVSWVIFAAAYFIPHTLIENYSLPLIIIAFSRIVDGITGGNISIANAYVADITTKKERSKVYGLIGAVFGLGFLIGPAIGGLSATTSIGYLGTTILAIIISTITLVLIIYMLPESLPLSKRLSLRMLHALARINVLNNIQRYKHNKNVLRMLTVRFLFNLIFATSSIIFTLYAKEYLGLTQTGLGLLFTYVGILIVFNQSIIVRFVVKKIGDTATLIVGQISYIIAGLLYLFKPMLIQTLGIIFITDMGLSLSMPTSRSLLTNAVSEKQQGDINGLDESLLSLTRAIGPFIGGALYASYDYKSFGIIITALILIQLPLILQGYRSLQSLEEQE